MTALPESLRAQWMRLIILTAAHFVLDMFPGMMHTILPAVQQSFGLSVTAGGVLLTVFLVGANGIQVLIGHVRENEERPLLLYVGFALTCTILLFGVVSPQVVPLLWLSAIALISGAGVGMTHPESLRAVHRLDGISSSVSSAVFMGGGVLGFAFGSVASTHLHARFGFAGLVPFCAAAVVLLVVLMLAGIRLAVERDETERQARRRQHGHQQHVPFRVVMAISILIICSVQILLWIVPQHISAIGADLTRGGQAVSLFTLAGGIGGMALARFAARRGELRLIIVMLAVSIPFVLGYVVLLRHSISVVLLSAGGFFGFGAYPIMVSMARHSTGPNLGQRMGLIVGGIWLFACVLPMVLGPVAEYLGTGFVILLTPAGFVLALLLAVATAIQLKKQSERQPQSSDEDEHD